MGSDLVSFPTFREKLVQNVSDTAKVQMFEAAWRPIMV